MLGFNLFRSKTSRALRVHYWRIEYIELKISGLRIKPSLFSLALAPQAFHHPSFFLLYHHKANLYLLQTVPSTKFCAPSAHCSLLATFFPSIHRRVSQTLTFQLIRHHANYNGIPCLQPARVCVAQCYQTYVVVELPPTCLHLTYRTHLSFHTHTNKHSHSFFFFLCQIIQARIFINTIRSSHHHPKTT